MRPILGPTAAITGFLTGLYVVLTPVLAWLLFRQKLNGKLLFAARLARVGLGTIATAIGVARASQRVTDIDAHGVTRVVLGDLAAVYDAGSLVAGDGRIQVIVGNNHGGRIFEDLEVAETAGAEVFERVMITPQTILFEHLAAAYGWEYRRVTTRGSLTEALSITTGPVLIEVDLPHAPANGI